MAYVEKFEVGIQQLKDFGLSGAISFKNVIGGIDSVREGDYVLVSRFTGISGDQMRVITYGSELRVYRQLATNLSIDVDLIARTGKVRYSYEIWEVADDADLWQAWEHDAAVAQLTAEYTVPAELACSKGFAMVGRSWVWGDYPGGEGEECEIYVNLQSEPYQYFVNSTLYGVSELVIATDSDGAPYFLVSEVLGDYWF